MMMTALLWENDWMRLAWMNCCMCNNITLAVRLSTMYTWCLKTLLLMMVVIAYLCSFFNRALVWFSWADFYHSLLLWRIPFRLNAVKFEFHTWEKRNVAHALVFAVFPLPIDVYILFEWGYAECRLAKQKKNKKSNYGCQCLIWAKKSSLEIPNMCLMSPHAISTETKLIFFFVNSE